jgi:hypothetical protein
MIGTELEALLAEAWNLPVAAIYRRTGWDWQRLVALCGPTSVADVLRSFGDEVDRARLLDGSGLATWFGIRLGGTTIDDLAQVVATKSPRRARVIRDLDLDGFRAELERANDPARRYIVNFDRRPVFGWGGGHHAPLLGYLPASDLSFVLDVNRRVGPRLIPAPRLHAAVATRDPSSGRSRGLLLVE